MLGQTRDSLSSDIFVEIPPDFGTFILISPEILYSKNYYLLDIFSRVKSIGFPTHIYLRVLFLYKHVDREVPLNFGRYFLSVYVLYLLDNCLATGRLQI